MRVCVCVVGPGQCSSAEVNATLSVLDGGAERGLGRARLGGMDTLDRSDCVDVEVCSPSRQGKDASSSTKLHVQERAMLLETDRHHISYPLLAPVPPTPPPRPAFLAASPDLDNAHVTASCESLTGYD